MKNLISGVLVGAVLVFANLLQAQTTELSDTTTDYSSMSDVEVEIKAIETTSPTPATNLPSAGNFYSAQHAPGSEVEWPPLPGNIYNLPAWSLGDDVFLLSDENFDYDAPLQVKAVRRSGISAMDLSPAEGSMEEEYLFSLAGTTNLWLAITNLADDTAGLLLSNTLAGISYEVQGNTDLTTTNWNSYGFVLGSALTNWTPTSITATDYPNLFLRVRSWQDDGSGLPIWWQLQYFGTTGVDPYGDPDGDGWNNLQEFQNGTNPNSFNTPPAPQGLVAAYNASIGTANISWLPSPGAVIGYILSTPSGTVSLSATATSYADNDSSLTTDLTPDDVFFADPTFQLQATYAGGNSASANASLAPNYPNIWLVQGAQGSNFLAISALPSGTAAIRLSREDEFAEFIYGDYSCNASNDIPISSFTNGLYYIPPGLFTAPVDAYGNPSYFWWAQTVNANGAANSQANYLGQNATTNVNYGIDSVYPLYADGQVQMKQNLIFQLRAAMVGYPLGYYLSDSYYENEFIYPGTYVYSGFYQTFDSSGDQLSYGLFDPFLPFENNYLYRNFVFNLSNVNQGLLTTGIWGEGSQYLAISNSMTYEFEPPATSGVNFSSLLSTNDARWLGAGIYIYGSIAGDIPYGQIGVSVDGSGNYHLSGSNYFGLPFVSVKIAYASGSGTATTTLDAGSSTTQGGYMYAETAQPQFQTVAYDFWNPSPPFGYPIPLPGTTGFSQTNGSDIFIVPVQGTISVAGYAKLSVTNGYSGVYGYLGQYFDQAYQIDSNGIVTTNTTGVLSSYGNFFATQPGPAALVTMPDVDTGQRGTGVVWCAEMAVDKNADSTMDLSFNGADATSQASPDEFWVNNDCDWSYYTGDVGKDIPCTSQTCDYLNQNIISQRDLEDWFRLWICGVPALTNGYQVTLSWANVSSGNPAVNLVQSVEADGGVSYLTNSDIAAEQVTIPASAKFARITTGQSYTFPNNYFDGSNKHFLFEGAGIGRGELVLTISQNGNTIAQTGVWLDLHDIQDFFEQVVITNNMSGAKSNWTSSIETVLPAVSALGNDTNLIVLVHGINVQPWDCVNDAETVCKRLYWAGYQGKFAEVEWPCNLINYLTFLTLDVDDFNDSEIKAYKASSAMATYLTQLRSRFPNYRLNILAHSQGNAVVSEAIEQGAPFDTYIMTQGALPASCYDVNTPTDSTLVGRESLFQTPEWQPMGYRGVYTNFTGRIVDFYNLQDKVLGYWYDAQVYFKPSISYSYDGTNSTYTGVFSSYIVTDPQESRANVSRSRTLAIGQEGANGVIRSTIDLNAQFGFNGGSTEEHSAQWTRPIQTCWGYYDQILESFLIPTIQR